MISRTRCLLLAENGRFAIEKNKNPRKSRFILKLAQTDSESVFKNSHLNLLRHNKLLKNGLAVSRGSAHNNVVPFKLMFDLRSNLLNAKPFSKAFWL